MTNTQRIDYVDARKLLQISARRFVFVKGLLAEEGVTEGTPGYKERLAQMIKQYDRNDY